MKTSASSSHPREWALPLRLAVRWSVISFAVPLIAQSLLYLWTGHIATAKDGSSRMLDCLTGPICLMIIGLASTYYQSVHRRNDGVIPSDDGMRYFSGSAIISGFSSVMAISALVFGYVHGFRTGMDVLGKPLGYMGIGLLANAYAFPLISALLATLARSRFRVVRYLGGK